MNENSNSEKKVPYDNGYSFGNKILSSCLSLKCKTGYGLEKRMARYSSKYWTQTELDQFEKLKAARDEL